MSSVWNIFCFWYASAEIILIVQICFTVDISPFEPYLSWDCQEYFYLNFTLFSACLIVFSTKFVQFEALLKITFFNRRCQKEPYYEPHNKEWIKENIYVMLRKQAGKWQHQKSRQSLHSWEFCTRLWSCFTDSLKIVFFQMQQFSFPIHSQVTFNTDKHVKELLMERFGMVTGFCQTVSKVRITYCTK